MAVTVDKKKHYYGDMENMMGASIFSLFRKTTVPATPPPKPQPVPIPDLTDTIRDFDAAVEDLKAYLTAEKEKI